MSIPEYKTPTYAETDRIVREARALRAEFIRDSFSLLGVRISRWISRSNEFRFPMGKPSEL